MVRRRPRYPSDSDYTTNAPSYYDDLARKNKLIKLLAEKIAYYDEELAKRFDEWDKNLEELPDELKRMFLEWVDDGTLARILAQLMLDEYATMEWVHDLFAKIIVSSEEPEHEKNKFWYQVLSFPNADIKFPDPNDLDGKKIIVDDDEPEFNKVWYEYEESSDKNF